MKIQAKNNRLMKILDYFLGKKYDFDQKTNNKLPLRRDKIIFNYIFIDL
ncbi:MAG: hypothetical protein ACXVA1_22000 [Mucilaginibacter sp.]